MLQAHRHVVTLGLRYKLYNNNFDCAVCERYNVCILLCSYLFNNFFSMLHTINVTRSAKTRHNSGLVNIQYKAYKNIVKIVLF